MKICIVEDEVIVADDLADIIQDYGLRQIELFHSFEDGLASLKTPGDAYILDIRLGDGDGVKLGEKLSKIGIPFIYITANNEIEVIKRAVHTKPTAYISKPFKERDIIAAIELLKSQINQSEVEIITSKGRIKIKTNTILFCKADDVYVHVITEKKNYIQRATLKEFSEKLSENFIRVHRSYLVNKLKVTAQKADKLFVNQIEIPVSRNFRGQF